jgi:hypothetical protein
MPLRAALPENKQVLPEAHRQFGAGALVEPDRNRTYRPPDESGAPPLSYGPITKDAGTMPECGFAVNQESGYAIMRRLVEPQKRAPSQWSDAQEPVHRGRMSNR